MVGLCAAGGEHYLRALALGVRQQELKLANLVAAQTDAGQVIALDVHVGVQQTADVLQLLDGVDSTASGIRGKSCKFFGFR